MAVQYHEDREGAEYTAREVERLAGRPERHRTGDSMSARNRFSGVVTSVEVDGVMALVEIEAGPHRVIAAVTRDSVEEPRSVGRLDGQHSVLLVVQKQSVTNTVAVIDTVKKKLALLDGVFQQTGRGEIQASLAGFERLQSGLKVTGMKVFGVSLTPTSDRPYVFCKLETNQGIVGWGEGTLEGKAGATMACIGDFKDFVVGADPMQALHHLLLPPLVRCAAVAVGDAQQGSGDQRRGRAVGGVVLIEHLHRRNSLPAVPAGVLEPHRRALIFSAARVAHRVDIHSERVTEPALHIARRQIDEKCRQLLVVLPSPSAQSGVVHTIIGWERYQGGTAS